MAPAKKTKIKLTNDKLPLMDSLVKNLELNHSAEWDEKGDVLTAKLTGGGIIIVTFPPEFTGDFIIEHDKKGGVLYKEIEFKISQDITQTDLNASIFKNLTTSLVKNGEVFLLGKNNVVFNEINEWFKSLKVEEVSYKEKLNVDFEETCFDKLTLILNPYDHHGRGWSYDYDKIREPYKELEGYRDPNLNGHFIQSLPSEKIIDIKLNDTIIGKYYKDRNMILMNVNPFYQVNIKELDKISNHKYLSKIMSDLSDAISIIKCKTVDNTKFKMKQMVRSFSQGAKQKLSDLMSQLESTRNSIIDYEHQLTSMYKESIRYNKDIDALTIVDENSIDKFIAEIEKVKEQPLITNVTTDNGMINITFKETTVKARVGRTNNGQDNDSGPIFEYFIGEITCHINGNGKMTVTSSHGDVEIAHPHVNQSQKPCLGSGDGPNMMHKLIGEMKFSDFVYVFWMWIKRYRPEDCYVKPYLLLDDRLKRGLPVFNQAGKRIEFGDEKLIEEGVLNSGDEKLPEYEDNMKKYKNFKPQG